MAKKDEDNKEQKEERGRGGWRIKEEKTKGYKNLNTKIEQIRGKAYK